MSLYYKKVLLIRRTRRPIRVGDNNTSTPNTTTTSLQTHISSPFKLEFPLQEKKNMLDPSTRLFENTDNLPDHTRHINDCYDHALNYGARGKKTAQNNANFWRWNSMGAETLKDNDSGVNTPSFLWTGPPTSPQHRPNLYRSLSPSSRAQAIARGQRELMEMVSKMPESCYELSLKDLVERPMIVEAKEESIEEGKSLISNENKYYYKKKMNDSKKVQIKRSESNMDNGGLLLKLVIPFSLGSKKKNKKNNNESPSITSSKVSPKPPVLSDGSNKGVDKEWWKKTFSVSSESENCGSSSHNSVSTKSSGSSSRSSSNRSNSRGKRVECSEDGVGVVFCDPPYTQETD
ncbi:hypothetical protein CFOL_v3_24277 [Cephalotus follicularis]|uniref:Uncharacterized protein n=1 Tax=Cephalotus follicularis TaxID=3775 RepID=A0A1Q3CKQ1_CEPFO|nr:hypothetical protein CFOL_v3_24277 [Cephalotus follicularis]